MAFNQFESRTAATTGDVDASNDRVMDSSELQSLIARTAKAPDRINREKSLGHPKNAPWKPGQPGMFDGTYIVEFVNSPRAFDANVQRNGDPIIKSNFRIVEVIRRPEYSGVTYNDRGEAVPWTAEMGEVEEGTDRDHVVWPKSGEPAAAEFKGLIQDRVVFLRGGVPGTFTKEEAAELLGPGQPMAGVRAKLTVSTEPQDKDSRKGFTHFRYRYLSKAADRVEDLVAQSMPTAPAMPAALAERFAAAKRPGFVPPEGA